MSVVSYRVSRRLVGAFAVGLLLVLALGAASARADDGATSWSQVTGQTDFTGVSLSECHVPECYPLRRRGP